MLISLPPANPMRVMWSGPGLENPQSDKRAAAKPLPQRETLHLLFWSVNKSALCPCDRHWLYLPKLFFHAHIFEKIIYDKVVTRKVECHGELPPSSTFLCLSSMSFILIPHHTGTQHICYPALTSGAQSVRDTV